MNKQILMFAVSLIVLFVGAGALGYWYINQLETDEIRMSTSKDSSSYSPNSSPNTKQQTSSLEVKSATDTKSNTKQQNQLPTPESFEVYEEYSNSTTAMYIDTVVGQGDEATSGDSVAMIYQGWLTSGELFDQSRLNENNQIEPFVFTLGGGQVIQGWEQGIIGMKEGGKRRLIIPSSVGYGPNGQGPIPPNAMLIFDVELVGLQEKAPGL